MHTIVLAFVVLRRIMDFPIHVIGCSLYMPHPIWSSHGVFSLSLFLSCKTWRQNIDEVIEKNILKIFSVFGRF